MVAGLEGIAMPSVTAPKLGAAMWQSGSNTITASSFCPSPKRPTRAWQRIPVPAVSRPGKIWKRTVAEPGLETDAQQYVLAMAELESQGQGARKRVRKMKYVPVWGEAQWDTQVEEPRDGTWDLAEARASVAAIEDEQTDTRTPPFSQRQATFSQENLSWVPRKRHSSRWPIEPTTKIETTMMAKLQPLLEFEPPSTSIDTAEAQHSPRKASEKQMRQRSTRRASRSVSFAPVEGFAMFESPVMRRTSLSRASPAKSSPTKKVSTSPQKDFTLQATPAKVLFRPSPSKARSPYMWKSPKAAQLSPPTPVVEAPEADESSMLSAESSVLVFEQPVPDVRVEPAYETSRRASLQTARRLDHTSIGGRKSAVFGPAQAPNRRHSFMPCQSGAESVELRGKRHTLDLHTLDLFSGSHTVALEMEQDEETTTGFSSAENTENISEVIVDVCANLDIFGTKSGVTRRRRGPRASVQEVPCDEVHGNSERDSASSPLSAKHSSSPQVDDSPLPIGLGITHNLDGAVDSPRQAAMLVTNDSDEANTPNKDLWLDNSNASTPCEEPTEPIEEEELQQDDMFAPHDPEGLSTIFEDEEASFMQSSPQRGSSVTFDTVILSSSPVKAPTMAERMSQIASSPPARASEVDHSTDILAEDSQHSDVEEEDSMEQSFDFTTVVVEDFVHHAKNPEDYTTPTEQLEHTRADEPFDRPSSRASTREEDSELDSDQQQSESSISQPEDDDFVVGEEDDYCGPIVVENFPAIGHAVLAQTESDGEYRIDASEESAPENVRFDVSVVSEVGAVCSPAADVREMDTLSSTPPQETDTADDATNITAEDAETVLETPPKGFTPINSDRVSPPVQRSPTAQEIDEDDQEEADDLQDEDMALAMDYEPTVPINMDEETITIEAPKPDTAAQEDSETEMLRKFVTRVSANKSAKAAAAALARRNLRPKRRSGSTGSTTSTGSPATKAASSSSLSSESAQQMMAASMSSSPLKARLPLGERDANSPSPTKKRKASCGSGKTNDLFRGNPALYSAEISPPKSKRLRGRRRVEPEAETSLTTSNQSLEEQQSQPQDGDSADSGPVRRSTRSRRLLKTPAPSANSIALSLIPVRLPGQSSMILNQADISGDKDMPTPVIVPRAARTTAEEKDLAAVTRVNTRKNKGGALPPKLILTRQADDPLGFKLKELKGAFDAKEEAEREEAEGRATAKGKGVRWASELVRFNTDVEAGSPPAKAVMGPLVPVRKGARTPTPTPVQPSEENEDGYFPHVDDTPAVEKAVTGGVPCTGEGVGEDEKPVEEKKEEKKEEKPVRRTRQSRLQMPTPISKKMLETPAAVAAPAPKVASASVVKMATRRTRIASLGMGVNGTPAPKRRTRA